MLSRTSPRPRVEPDVDLLLHGPRSTAGAVTLAWRRDIECRDIDDPSERLAATNEILQLVPPNALEGCEVPLREVRAWLADRPLEMDTGDVEGGQAPITDDGPAYNRQVICWRGKGEDVVWTQIDKLAPGAVIVLRSDDGGYDRFGWAPTSEEPVPDIADEAFSMRTGRVIERIETNPDVEDNSTGRTGFRAHLWTRGVVFEQLADGGRSRIVEAPIPLDEHSQRVAAKAREYADNLGLDNDTLYAAGLFHDRGKAHPGWQLRVNGGDPAALQKPALAKGPFVPSPLSRLPRGWRHEAESLKRLPDDASELLQWLVATHHGHARPFWPIPAHGIGLADMMDRLQLAHGYWTLALLEALLRCADRKVSEEEMADA